jgi:exopolysaccharide production protein ExoF
MRTMRTNLLMAVVVVTLALACVVAYGRDLAPRKPAPEDGIRTPLFSMNSPLGIGDRLKISFYETIDVGDVKRGSRDGADPQSALRTFYQRMDVSGEYVVGQDGVVSIPLLGRFQVEGLTLDDIRADLVLSFRTVIGRTADVSATVVERSPVYVVGPVKNPGAYKYAPGMIVLHAIALAGGLDRGQENLLGMIEGVREIERSRSKADQVKHLLARRARLEALRDDTSILPMPIQLVQLAGEQSALTFLATESMVLKAEKASRQHQENELEVRIAAARNEVEVLRRKLDQVDAQKDIRIERLNDMQKLKDRGIVTTNTVVMLRTELSDIETRRADNLVAVAQAEARLAAAAEAKARLKSEQAATLAKELAVVDQEIATAQAAMISAGTIAATLFNSTIPASQAHTYEIVRQSKDGPKTLAAMDTSSLMPGDVLKINTKTASGTPLLETANTDVRRVRSNLPGPN